MDIRENVPQYLEELKSWLADTADVPLEEMSDFFTARLEGYEEHMQIWAKAYARLPEYVGPEVKRVLDLGCGTGLEIDQLFAKRPDVQVTGLDLSKSMLAALADKYPDKLVDEHLCLICDDYFQYPFEEDTYDMVISVESLHHFKPEKKLRLFQKIYEALPEGGTFLNVDYIACCQEEEDVLFAECARRREAAGISEEQFVHFDTPLTLEHEMGLLREAGFSQVEALENLDAVFIRAVK